MIKAFFQKWFTKQVVKPEPQLSIFTSIEEVNKSLDNLIFIQKRMFEADELALQLIQMATFSKTEEFQIMSKNKADLVAFLDKANNIHDKLKNL